MNKKDGFNGSLQIGDRLFPESIELGLGDVVTAENIETLTAIFTNESLDKAIEDSIGMGECITIIVDDIPHYAKRLQRTNWDVDWDRIHPNEITIFGDKPSDSDEPQHWVLRLVSNVPQSNPYAE
jgi:hypothetical protein